MCYNDIVIFFWSNVKYIISPVLYSPIFFDPSIDFTFKDLVYVKNVLALLYLSIYGERQSAYQMKRSTKLNKFNACAICVFFDCVGTYVKNILGLECSETTEINRV